MNIDELYSDTILKLKNNVRPHIKLTPELILDLKNRWKNALIASTPDESTLKKILCILDNTQNNSAEFNELFINTLTKIKNQELIIYTLAASQKHVISESMRSGNMISMQYFEQIKNLLKNKNPEVLEWTLRTIESMGPLSMRLKNEVRRAKPGFMKLFSQHQKSAAQIIELLESQWKRML